MDQQDVKIEYFADPQQDNLEKWITEYICRDQSKVSNEEMDDEFARRSTEPSVGKWIRQQGLLRLCQALINLLSCQSIPIARIQWLFKKFASKSSIDDTELLCKLMQVIDPIVHPQLVTFESTWVKHRNVCLVLSEILYTRSVQQDVSHRLLDYLIRIVDHRVASNCQIAEAQLWALMVLEKLCLQPKLFDENRISQIIEKLRMLSLNLDRLGSRFYKMDFDFISYQVGFSAKWLLDNILEAANPLDPNFAPVKMLSDHLLARSDSPLFPPVRSQFPIINGVYFYEVVLLTDGPIRIGWASRECEFEQNETDHLGDDEFSIAFEGSTRSIWHEKKEYAVKVKNYSWKAGDVLGALIDMNESKFAFYINGHLMHHKRKLAKKFSKFAFYAESMPMYAVASLGPHQQVFFNFGQQPFAYPPREVKYADFHITCGKNPKKYQLLETSLAGGSYWFKQVLIDNTVEPLYHDAKQREFNRWVKELETRMAEDDYDFEFMYGDHKWEFESLMKDELAYLRLIQAIIRKMGTMIADEQIHIVVGWILYYISSLDDTLSAGRDLPEIWFFDKSDHDSNGTSPHLPMPARFFELIYPYMQLQPKSDPDVLKIRNTCIALSILARKYWYLKDFLDEEVLRFVTRTIVESQDSQSILFSLICLDHLTMDQQVKEKVLKCINLPNLAKYLDQLSVSDVYCAGFDETRYQLAFCARWCLNYVLVDDSVARKPRDETRDSLNAESRTEHMKLSPDQLSARSDDGWQSVRSSFAVSTDVYFYEVILITSGPMRIGWATQDTDFFKTNVGDDKHSIGIDRFQRCIWHDADRYKIKSQPPWEAGDVIGCLIDVPNEKFVFYLNGKMIETRRLIFKKVNFEAEPYYAAVTLWPHQQCFFNFGQASFKYPPKGVPYRDFHTTSVSSSATSSPSLYKHSILRRKIFDIFPSAAASKSVALNPPTIK